MSQNLLAAETSPYLLQHKDNPVHWRPWGPDALDEAKREGKPILLSVGYAACHWCHVMAHESFEDPDVAAVMNDLFVNVKVDREERPDIDTIYMSALQSLGENGGWPLTMFLTPEGEPFWGGTYFPKTPAYGRPGFTDVLREIHRIYTDEFDKVSTNRDAIRQVLENQARAAQPGRPMPELLDQVAARLADHLDPDNGGIGGAPKFPQPFLLEFFWRAWLRTGDARFRDAVTLTLTRMCQGGIYDHLGGGFARYAVDAEWLVPHFEKMLYDNASLLRLLTLAAKGTGNPLFEARLHETVDWLLREMVTEEGAFAASLDADSEGEEGKFYVWAEDEIDAALGNDAALFKRVYDVTPEGNFEGKSILNRLAHPEPLSPDDETILARCRGILFQQRAPRTRPGWDDKALADWNGLAIDALARAGAAFGEADWIDAARRAYDFIRTRMVTNDRLHHAFRAGKLQHLAMADGLANMIGAALALYETTSEAPFLEQAEIWAAELDAHFWDPGAAGYFFTADDAEALVVRTRTVSDNATPAANGTMVGHLSRLWYLTGNPAYRDRADALIEAFATELQRNFFPMTSYLNGLDTRLNAIQTAIIGDPSASETRALAGAALASPLPQQVVMTLAPDAALPDGHPAAGKGLPDGAAAAAYVCEGTACSLPVTAPADLEAGLRRPATAE